jgi:hypothetical protein
MVAETQIFLRKEPHIALNCGDLSVKMLKKNKEYYYSDVNRRKVFYLRNCRFSRAPTMPGYCAELCNADCFFACVALALGV